MVVVWSCLVSHALDPRASLSAIRRIPRSVPSVLRCRDPAPGANELVEDGVLLPPRESEQALKDELAWLEEQITSWLDNEWPDPDSARLHGEIAAKVSQFYMRVRKEGIHDLYTLLLGIGAGLEGLDGKKG